MMDITISSATTGGMLILLVVLAIVVFFVGANSFSAGKNAELDQATDFFNSTHQYVVRTKGMDNGKEVSTILTFTTNRGDIELNFNSGDDSLLIVQDNQVVVEKNSKLSTPYPYSHIEKYLQDA